MKVTVEYPENISTKEINVVKAEYIGDYKIRIFFSTNENKIVDFKSFLLRSTHPEIKKYLNENLFKSYKIVNGNLNWNDFDLIFPVADLYENKIIKTF